MYSLWVLVLQGLTADVAAYSAAYIDTRTHTIVRLTTKRTDDKK